jgi:uncharacterized membrane protein YkvA (DUF1232 family)
MENAMKQQRTGSTSQTSDVFLGSFDRMRLSWRLLRDERVAAWMKWLVPIIAAIYLVAPIDLVPDLILGFGQIDDLSVVGIAIFAMTKILPKIAPRPIVEEHLADMFGQHSDRHRRGERSDVIDTSFEVVREPSAKNTQRSSVEL